MLLSLRSLLFARILTSDSLSLIESGTGFEISYISWLNPIALLSFVEVESRSTRTNQYRLEVAFMLLVWDHVEGEIPEFVRMECEVT